MTRYRYLVILLAALAALTLCACGDTVVSDSAPDGIETFGVQADPSAQPSFGQTVAGQNTPAAGPGTTRGPIVENNAQTSSAPGERGNDDGDRAGAGNGAGTGTGTGNGTGTGTGTGNGNGTGTGTGTGTGNGGTTQPSASPSQSDEPGISEPSISPPMPASTATADDVSPYIGRQLSELIADWGVPYRSDYEDVDEDDPNTARVGTLYFDGFTVTTLRDENGEVIKAVTPD